MASRKRKKGTHVDAREVAVGRQQVQFNIALILQGIFGGVSFFFLFQKDRSNMTHMFRD